MSNLQTFGFRYQHGGKRWAISVEAETRAEAEEIISAIGRAEFISELTLDVDDTSKTKPLCVITPAMIQAGVATLREKMIGEPLERIVQDVFLAMWIEEHSNELGE